MKFPTCPMGWTQVEPGDGDPFGGALSLSPPKAGAAWKHRANPAGAAPVSPAPAGATGQEADGLGRGSRLPEQPPASSRLPTRGESSWKGL